MAAKPDKKRGPGKSDPAEVIEEDLTANELGGVAGGARPSSRRIIAIREKAGGRICGFAAMPLSWHPAVSPRRRPKRA